MIIFLYTIICAAFLNEFNAVPWGKNSGKGSKDSSSSNNDLENQQHPIQFACISYPDKVSKFHMINESNPSDLVDYLNNKSGLSLFFHGASYVVNSTHDLFASFVDEWSKKSKNNICVVTYALSNGPESIAIADKMVSIQRLEYVAKKIGDFVLGLPSLKLSQVDVSGFGFGAHIAGRTCQYLNENKKGERVRMLLALDPIKTTHTLARNKKKDSTIKSGDAEYVQVIHTSKKVGIWDKLGDVDVYVKYVAEKGSVLNDEHGIAFFIHVATSTQRLYLSAGPGEKAIGDVSPTPYIDPKIKASIERMGVYGIVKTGHRGNIFGISLTDKNAAGFFWDRIGDFCVAEIFTGIHSRGRNQCIKCTVQKNKFRLSCGHRMCGDCLNRSRSGECPLCTKRITKCDEIEPIF